MEKKFNSVVDSGKRQKFDTGSVRDTDEGKGQPHLIAGEVFYRLKRFMRENTLDIGNTNDLRNICYIEELLFKYGSIVEERDEALWLIYKAIQAVINETSWENALNKLAIHYQNGSKKYNPNNWLRGQPISRYYDSAMRHLWKLREDLDDEDHYAALLWNLVAIIQTKICVNKGYLPKELNDYPFTVEDIWGNKNE